VAAWRLVGLSICLRDRDELAFVGRNIQQEFWKSISPTLSTGGACIISSTPNGEGDLFSEIWHGAEVGSNGFTPVFVAWNEPPGRDEKFKAEQIAQLGELAWNQEYDCQFLTSEAILISTLFLQNLDKTLENIIPIRSDLGVTWFDKFKQNGTYLMGVDPSSGSGKDYSVIQVFEFPTLMQVAEFRSNNASSPQLYSMIKYILKQVSKADATCYFSVENNGVGEGVIALYQNDENLEESGNFISEDGRARLGMVTTSRSKLKACLNLKSLLEGGKMSIKSRMLVKELKTYATKGGAYEALPGSTDDLIAATLIVVRLLAEIAMYEQQAHDTLYEYSTVSDQNDNQEYDYTNGDEAYEEPLGIVV